MKNHELLDMISDVNEDYVLEAGDNVAKPRFNWKPLAACAACAALALGAYHIWWAAQPYEPLVSYENDCAPEATQDPTRTLIQAPGLHDYTLVEQDVNILTTQGGGKASGGGGEPAPDPGLEPPRGSGPTEAGADADSDAGGALYSAPTMDNAAFQGEAAVQEAASAQYEQLLLWMLGTDQPEPSSNYPEWFGGVWLEGEHLTVAIVDELRTSGLEAQITRRCGGTQEVLFTNVKYSQNYLDGLMDEVCAVFDQYGWISSVIDANEMTNRVEVDIFGEPSDAVLAELARLDPEGDAIFIQVFYGGHLSPTAQSGKAPSCDPGEYDPSGERAEPAMDPETFPTPTPIDGSDDPADTANAGDFPAQPSTAPAGSMPSGARAADGLPEKKRDTYDALKAADAQGKAHYDLITEGE